MDLEDLLTADNVRVRHNDLAVEAAWPQQRRIENVRTVGRRDQDDTLIRLETVHLDEHLVQCLLALVIAAAETGAAMTADHMARNAVPLATLNEVCLALRDFGPERPPAGWWASLPGALAATPKTAVWGRPALDAPLVEDLRDAHEVAGRLCERVLGEDPTAQPWVAAAAFVLNAGDGWRGPMYTLAAMEHALASSTASYLSSTATYTIREFASRLLVALIDGHWPRLKLLNEVPGRGTLFVDVLRALHRLGVAPRLRVNRDPPGTLTAEQEAYAGANLTPRTTGHECLIVEAYAGTGKSHSTLQFAARRQAAGDSAPRRFLPGRSRRSYASRIKRPSSRRGNTPRAL